MKVKRKIIEIDEERCTGCGECVLSCAEGAIEIVDGKARLSAEKYCDGLGACLRECPVDALKIIEREAEEFDEEAVEEHLKEAEEKRKQAAPAMACGCPSSQIQSFGPSTFSHKPGSDAQEDAESTLSHWPIQIRLVPPTAPFLKGADLLVVADCAPVALPDFHRRFLPGKTVLMGCPKFDNVEEYVQKFSDIFKTAHIKSVTVLDMEVPCCSALPAIVRKGMDLAGKEVPIEEIVVGRRGSIRKQEKIAA
jgi:NAD-dependent dihydropyrimidine dehydrogenase PreA subunit